MCDKAKISKYYYELEAKNRKLPLAKGKPII